jgi:molecular chaperone Hsp33
MTELGGAAIAARQGTMSSADDVVWPFEVKPLGVRGRLVRLGQVVDGILHQHDYPAPVSALLAEATALASLLGSALKFEGTFILQTRSDGPVSLMVADYASPGNLRGYAQFDEAAVASLQAGKAATPAALLGKGHLAMTIDQGAGMDRYQGIVPLECDGLEGAAHGYFRNSEQIPTTLRLAAGPMVGRGPRGRESWRAGAIMIQHLPREGGSSPIPLTSGDAPEGHAEATVEDDRWVKARLLLQTVQDHELLDPMLSPERLLYRLFHEDGVTVYRRQPVARKCSCSRERARNLLGHFDASERAAMLEDGKIVVTCQFCSARYRFDPDEGLEDAGSSRPAVAGKAG